MPAISISLLGGFHVTRDGAPITRFRSDKVRALLAHLAVEADRPISRAILAGLLWPEQSDDLALRNLAQSLVRLREALGDADGALLEITRQTIRLQPGPVVDVLEFCRLAERDNPVSLQAAADRYTGDLLLGFALKGCEAFEEWLLISRERLARLALATMARLAEHHLATGSFEAAAAAAHRQIALDPWSEMAHQQLMRALAGAGNRGAALAAYDRCRSLLLNGLGVEPDSSTWDLFAQIRDGRLAVAAPPPVAGESPPPGRRQAGSRVDGLPLQSTNFIGRVHELADLGRLLSEPANQLLTIIGPGGMGKTRLAIAVAERLSVTERYRDGVCFVPLAPLTAPDQLVPALVEALSLPLVAGAPSARSPRQQILDYLREKRLLLILDNIEQLLEEGEPGDMTAEFIAALLAAAPGVTLLVTSRTPLQLREERRYPLGRLELPAAQAPPNSSAVTLFLERAQQLRPDFTSDHELLNEVAKICRLLDGMPLAIELAAGWVDTLGLPEIAAEIARSLDLLETRLRNVPQRHRSIRAVFDVTRQRLAAADQPVFARLAVFRGGGTRHAVQAVTGATLAQMQALVSVSLLQYDPESDRYRIHELLRQYAAEQLTADSQDALATGARHAAYYCAFVAARAQALKGAGQEEALRAIEREAANLYEAIAWAGAHGVVPQFDQAAMESMGRFYQWRGHYEEGLAAFATAATALVDADTPDTRRIYAHALIWQAIFAGLLGHVAQAAEILQRAGDVLEAATTAGADTRAERAFALLQLNLPHQMSVAEIQRRYAASLALYSELGRPWEQSNALLGLGMSAWMEGDYARARGHLGASRAIREALGDRRGLAEVLNQESLAAAMSGAVDEGLELAERSAAIYEALGETASQAFGLRRLGNIQVWAGMFPEALQTLTASRALYAGFGDELWLTDVDALLAYVMMSVGELEGAWAQVGQAIARYRTLIGADDPQALGFAGVIALMRGEPEEGERLIQASMERSAQMGTMVFAYWVRPFLPMAWWQQGRRSAARAELLAQLREISALANVMALLPVILAISLISAEDGALERAVELYALACQSPSIGRNQALTTFFGAPVQSAAAALAPEAAEAGLKRDRAGNLHLATGALLTELEASGWGQAHEHEISPTGHGIKWSDR